MFFSDINLIIFTKCDNMHWRIYVINRKKKAFEILCSYYNDLEKDELQLLIEFICIVCSSFFGDDTKQWKFINSEKHYFLLVFKK